MVVNQATSRAAQAGESRTPVRSSRVSTEPSRFQRMLGAGQQPAGTKPAGAAPATPAAPAAASSAANVFGLVTRQPAPPVERAAAAPAEAHPTVESVFGASPWASSPTGFSGGGGAYGYNPQYFATRETAEKVAQLLGGKVVEQNAMVGSAGPFYQSQPNLMVQLPNGHMVNAGLTATYYTHGWSQSMVDRMLQYDREV